MKIPPSFNNPYYLACINLAKQSKGNERYGSIIVSDGSIIGCGFNRAIAHWAFGKLPREIRQGMANHAEVEAMNDALSRGFSLVDTEMYVAGYFPKTGQLFFKKQYTCVKCIPYLRAQGIVSISVPTPNRWIKKTLDQAEREAKLFINGTHKKRLEAVIGEFFIDSLI